MSNEQEVAGNTIPQPPAQKNFSENFQSKNWCLTWNNPGEVPGLPAWITYLVWQEEFVTCKHYQMYLECSTKRRMGAIKKIFPRAHIESRKGTQAEAIAYCKKPESRVSGPWELGEPCKSEQGKRNDILDAIDTLKKKRKLADVAEEHPETFVKYHRGLERYLQVTDTTKRDWKTEVHIFYGDAGTGKSRKAAELAPGAYYLQKNVNTLWWDGYDGQDVIIDDFYGWIQFDTMLRMMDRYPFRVEYKGGSKEFTSRRIFITSNCHWEFWYSKIFDKNAQHREAFGRRITSCEEFKKATDETGKA